MEAVVATPINAAKDVMNNLLFRSVLSGMTGYFVYPHNDALVRFVRRNEWVRYVFLFLLIWQSPTGGSLTRTSIATAIVYIIASVVAPMLDNTPGVGY